MKRLILMITVIIAFMATNIVTVTEPEIKKEPKPEPKIIEVIEPENVRTYFDVPLSEELQNYIFDTCEQYEIDPAIVVAVIWRESRYNADSIGDNGNSFGLMQIQKKWHVKRMENLGGKDLLNPYDNVLVGIDILAEKLKNYGNIGQALTAYNCGDTGARKNYFSKGIAMNNYAKEVLAKTEEIKNEKNKIN